MFDHNFDRIMVELLLFYLYGIWEFVKVKNGYFDACFLIMFDLFVVVTLWWGGAF